MAARAREGTVLRAALALLTLTALLVGAACSACGKSPGGGPNVTPGTSGVVGPSRTAALPDAGAAAVRDVAMWTAAREGGVEDLASLATHEGAAGLLEASGEAELRPTALRAMAYARGWAQVPYLAQAAATSEDAEARLALGSLVELAARPRRSEDLEDEAELRDGCDKLGALVRDAAQARERRIGALRALRMMPCPRQELPAELDAR
jgi:hypothetical protein